MTGLEVQPGRQITEPQLSLPLKCPDTALLSIALWDSNKRCWQQVLPQQLETNQNKPLCIYTKKQKNMFSHKGYRGIKAVADGNKWRMRKRFQVPAGARCWRLEKSSYVAVEIFLKNKKDWLSPPEVPLQVRPRQLWARSLGTPYREDLGPVGR